MYKDSEPVISPLMSSDLPILLSKSVEELGSNAFESRTWRVGSGTEYGAASTS
jgi:hypothetical protein